MSYELGQQVALEKVGVFQQWVFGAGRDRPAALLPVRARGSNFASTASEAIKNIGQKYRERAPNEAAKLVALLTSAAQATPRAPVSRLRIGGTPGESATRSYWSRNDKKIALGETPSPAGVLAHELGHSLPGRLLSDMDEEARATHNAIAALGQGHPDIPDLLRNFGTYVQNDTKPNFSITPAALPKRVAALWERYDPDAAVSLTPAYTKNKGALERQRRAAYRRKNKASDANIDYAESMVGRLKQRLSQDSSKAELIKKLPKYEARRLKSLDAPVQKEYDDRSKKINDADTKFRSSAERKQQFLIRAFGEQAQPTLADYAKLQGAEREQLDNWIASMRDKIDQHFWTGAGDTALEPILKRLEELRSA